MNGATLLPTSSRRGRHNFSPFHGLPNPDFCIPPFPKEELIGIVKDPYSIVTSAMLIIMVNKMAESSQPKFVRMPLFWLVCCLNLVMLAAGVRCMIISPMHFLGNRSMNFSGICRLRRRSRFSCC